MFDLNKMQLRKKTLLEVAISFCDYTTENSLFETIMREDDFMYVTLVDNTNDPSEYYAIIEFSPNFHLPATVIIRPYPFFQDRSIADKAADYLARQFIQEEILGIKPDGR